MTWTVRLLLAASRALARAAEVEAPPCSDYRPEAETEATEDVLTHPQRVDEVMAHALGTQRAQWREFHEGRKN